MMKRFILAVSLLSSVPAMAAMQTLPKGSRGISSLSGTVVDVRPLCPDGVTCFTNGTVVTVRYELQGCMDSLVDLGATAVEADGELKVFISAANLHNDASLRAFCVVAPTVTRQYTFIMKFGEVHATFLGTSN